MASTHPAHEAGNFHPAVDSSAAPIECKFYTIAVEAPDMVRIAMIGFWTERIVADFLRDIGQVIDALPCRLEPTGCYAM